MARTRVVTRRTSVRMNRQWIPCVSKTWGSSKQAYNGIDLYGYSSQLVPIGDFEGVTGANFTFCRDMTVLAAYGSFHNVPASTANAQWYGGAIGMHTDSYFAAALPTYGAGRDPHLFFAACPLTEVAQPGEPWNVIASKSKRKVRHGHELFLSCCSIGTGAVTLGSFKFMGRILVGYV